MANNTNELTAKLKVMANTRLAVGVRVMGFLCSDLEALTEALEAAEKRIVALQGLRAQLCANADRDIAALRQRIASLEARTLTVKLPAHKYRECVNGLLEEAIAYAGTQQLRERLSSRLANFVQPDHPHARCAAAGIKLKIEGE